MANGGFELNRAVVLGCVLVLILGVDAHVLGIDNDNSNGDDDPVCLDPPPGDIPACCCTDDDGSTVCQDASWGCLLGWLCPSECVGPVDNCPDDCPTDGACCYPDISCDDNSTPTECEDSSGNYQGDGTTCGEEAICCLPDGSGLCGAERCCVDELDGGFQSGLACNATGNDVCCCLGEDVYLSHAIDACCEYAEGESVTTADGTCGDVGACCMGNGDCFETAEACCPGSFLGAGTQCGVAAACCLDNGGCIDSTTGCCKAALNGEYDLPGKVCIDGPCGYDEVQACCLPDGGCIETLPDSCVILLGSPLGSGSTCSPQPQVCCFGTSCEVMDPQCCVLQDGVVHDETSCTPDNPCECSVDLDIDSNSDGVVDINDDSIEEVAPGKYIILGGDAASMPLVLYPNESGGRYKITYPDNLVEVTDSAGAVLLNGAEFDTPLNNGHELLLVTGVKTSSSLGDVVIVVEQDCDNDGSYDGQDTVVATVISIDLDADSDNTNGTDSPDRSTIEDDIEDDPNLPGKYIAVNRDNDDDPEPFWEDNVVHERIDDFIDGCNLDGDRSSIDPKNLPEQDNHNPDEDDFMPIVLEIPRPVDLSVAEIRFQYEGSNPLSVLINDRDENAHPNRRFYRFLGDEPTGGLRIWRKPGHEPRNPFTMTLGDYVGDDGIKRYAPADFGIDDDNRSATLYVEGVKPSPGLGQNRIVVELDPDGPGPLGFIAQDAVRWTIVDVEFMAVDNPPSDFYGFDDTINPRGIMVPTPAGSTTAVKVLISGGAAVHFRSLDEPGASVPNGPFSGEFDLTVTSGDFEPPGAVMIEAYLDTPEQLVIRELRAITLERIELTVQFHKVSDSAGHAAVADEARAQAHLDFLNESWGLQANIFFKAAEGHALFVEDPQIQQDLGEVVQVQTTESEAVVAHENPDVECDVFFVWNIENDDVPDDDPDENDVIGVAPHDLLDGHTVIFIDDANLMPISSEWTIAHEMGHYAANGYPFRHLMHLPDCDGDEHVHLDIMASPPDAWRLTLRQAITASIAINIWR